MVAPCEPLQRSHALVSLKGHIVESTFSQKWTSYAGNCETSVLLVKKGSGLSQWYVLSACIQFCMVVVPFKVRLSSSSHWSFMKKPLRVAIVYRVYLFVSKACKNVNNRTIHMYKKIKFHPPYKKIV